MIYRKCQGEGHLINSKSEILTKKFLKNIYKLVHSDIIALIIF